MQKRRTTHMGEYTGSDPDAYRKRASLESAEMTAEKNKKLTFYGISRGEEYTPVTGSGGRMIPIHGVGKLVVEDKIVYENTYVVLHFKFLRFAKEMKLNSYYEFTSFFCESYEPSIFLRGTQTKLHFYILAQFNLSDGLYKELDGRPFAQPPADDIMTSLKAIRSFFEQANPSEYGRQNKPIVNSAFKVISENGDSVVGGGLVKSEWRLGDAEDTILFSVVGDNRARFNFVVGNVYKGFGMNLFYNGNAPAAMQPTQWAHVEKSSETDAFKDVETVASVNEATKHFIFTMVKFNKIQMQCPSSGCLKLVDVGKKSKLLTCGACRCTFRADPKKLRVDMALNGIETQPVKTPSGELSTVSGPCVDNFRLFKYDLVKELLNVSKPEVVFENSKMLEKASMVAMKKLFEVTYDSEALTIIDLKKYSETIPGLFSVEEEEVGSEVSDEKEETESSIGGKRKKKKLRSSSKYKVKKGRHQKKEKKRSRSRSRHGRRRGKWSSSSSSAESMSSKSGASSDSDSSGHTPLAEHVKARQEREAKEAENRAEKKGSEKSNEASAENEKEEEDGRKGKEVDKNGKEKEDEV